MKILVTAFIRCVVLLAYFALPGAWAQGTPALRRVANHTLRLPNRIPVAGYGLENAFPGVTFDQPVALAAPPPETNRLFVVERTGSIYVITNLARPTKTLFLGLSPRVESNSRESGLLGLAFHPGFATNRFFFVYRTAYTSTPGAQDRFHDVVSRFEVSAADPNAARPDSELTILAHVDDSDQHNGGDLKFGPDGYLYVSIGERVGRNLNWPDQTPVDRDLHGAILRIDVDRRPGNLPPNRHPASTPNYSIPADNPFVGVRQHHGLAVDPAQVRTELYATGFRNPWRIAFDPVTGDLYVGDVGASRQEEVNLVVAGGDYGWPYREGLLPVGYLAPPQFSPRPPLHTYAHGWSGGTNGDCVIGGVVYRGQAMPWLQGRYLFADFRSGYLWSLARQEGGAPVELLLGTTIGLSAFGTDPRDGEILTTQFFDGTIHRLVYVPPAEATNLPPTLADTGVFADLLTLRPSPGVVPYDLNVPFWSDHAQKRRWFCVPEANRTMAFNPTGAWTFPTGAVWIKHFELELTNGLPQSARRLETRVLVNTAEGFYGLTYRWGDSLTNAWLVPAEGLDEHFVIRDTRGAILREQDWRYPSRAECMNCHTKWASRVAGFTTAQLNRTVTYGGKKANQIRALAAAGYLEPIPAANAELPALAAATDPNAPLEFRARSYFQANCAVCHVPGAHAFTAWDARLTTPLAEARIVSEGGIITPGSVPQSVLYHRLQGAYRLMPPIGTTVLNTNAIDLIANWITNLPPAPWSYQSIGNVLHYGGCTVSNGVYRVDGAGGSLEGTKDSFEFVHQPFEEPTAQFVARLASLNVSNSQALAGLMIREGTESADRFVMVGRRKDRTVVVLRRGATGAATVTKEFGSVVLPQWLRLVRRGDDFSAFRSRDGTNWFSLGTVKWAVSNSLEVGFAVNSRSRTAFNNAVFDSVSTLSVTLTSPSPSLVQQPADIRLEAKVKRSGREVARVEFFDGDTKLGEAAAEPYFLTASNVWAGVHQFSTRAVDAAGAAVLSQPLALTVQPSATQAEALEQQGQGGAWPGRYGANGYIIAQHRTNLPAYADMALAGATAVVWTRDSRDPRALAQVGMSRRIAAAWRSATAFTLTLALRHGGLQQLSLYFLDWNTADERVQRVDFVDPATGRVLTSQVLSNFSAGVYLTLIIRGTVEVRVTALAGPNAVMSGVFLDNVLNALPAVTLLSPVQGQSIDLPADLVLESNAADPESEVRRVEYYLDGKLVSAQRASPFRASIPGLRVGTHAVVARAYDALQDHQDSAAVTFEAVLPRAKAIFLREDATTRGDWLRQYGTEGFLLPPRTNWWPEGFPYAITRDNTYLQLGFKPDYLQLPHDSARVFPLLYSYSNITYALNLEDGQARQLALYFLDYSVYPQAVTLRDASTGVLLDSRVVTNGLGGRYLVWNVQGNVSLQVSNLTPGTVQTRVSGLFLDPFTNPPPQVALVLPATDLNVSTPAKVLLSATALAVDGVRSVEFHTSEAKLGEVLQPPYDFTWEYPAEGTYQVFARAISAAGGASDSQAVTVNVRFATPASARFVGADTETAGDWKVKYGTEGYWLPGNNNFSNLPPSVSIVMTQQWVDYGFHTLPQALLVPNSVLRVLSCWFGESWRFQIRLNDGRPHRLSLYNYIPGRFNSVTVTLRPTGSEEVLDSRPIASQDAGTYLTWELQGDVTLEMVSSGEPTAFLNAIFVDPVRESFNDWQRSYFTADEQVTSAVSSEGADPDSDGYDNWSEYLLGRNPRSPESRAPLWIERDAGGTRLHVLLAKATEEDAVSLQSSPDLRSWLDVPQWQPSAVHARGSQVERIYPVAPGNPQAQFFRLRFKAP